MELMLHHPSHPTFIITLSHTSTKTLRYSFRPVNGCQRFLIGIGRSVISRVTETRAMVIRAI